MRATGLVHVILKMFNLSSKRLSSVLKMIRECQVFNHQEWVWLKADITHHSNKA